MNLSEAAELIRTRRLSPVELTRECLQRIEKLNPQLNAFISVTAEIAETQAKKAETEITAGNWRGPLHGIPVALKDNIDTAGVLTTAGSNQFRSRVPDCDSDLAKDLKRAGAVLVGKTNMHEFAFGGSGIVSAFGPARNPADPERITGGSSSGSAAAVGAGMCVVAFGTDTAGSVRCPAALCGVVGHRPSHGWFNNAGTIPLAATFDTVGPITQTVLDAAILLDTLAPLGFPPARNFVPVFDARLTGLRLRVVRNFAADTDAEVARALADAITTVRSLGASVDEVELHCPTPMPIRSYEIYEYHRHMLTSTPELYQPGTLDRVKGSAGVDEVAYLRARQELRAFVRDLHVLDGCDAVLSPTVPVLAPKLAELEGFDSARLRQYEIQHLLCNTLPFSTLWWPSITVPCVVGETGLPIGLQISAPPGADHQALRVAHAFQVSTTVTNAKP